jgi:predicted ATPase/DNA-binding winged helix-turn-helix (wHTH) protein
MTSQGRDVYALNHWEIDLDRRELRSHGVPVSLGARAFEVLEALLRSSPQLVTKTELISIVWPNVIVGENTLHVHVSAIRKAFGPDRVLLKTASGRGYRLTGDWTVQSKHRAAADQVTRAPSPALKAVQSNLPVRMSGLIGRTGALRKLKDVLSAFRVVTLTGMGGIGKTSLALEAARDELVSFGGDVWLVELGALVDLSLVPSTVASILGIELGRDEISPLAVARSIGRRKLLLVLDNCEHLIDSAAKLVETIVHLCPGTTVLATSREPLRIGGEYCLRVPALEVPSYQGRSEELVEHSAVQLFLARVQSFDTDFLPREADLRAIASICRRLDGIPLAIELAAARAATLGLEQVRLGLDDRFSMLTGGSRTALPRHRALRATLDWSHHLLPEAERRVLRHLAVFPAGFTLEAVTAVLGKAKKEMCSTEECVANLVSKSLVVLERSGETSRWRLLETTRAYALHKLKESSEFLSASRRHAEFFRDVYAIATSDTHAGVEGSGMARSVLEIDNARAALDWAFSEEGDTIIGVQLTAACVPVWLHLSLLAECRERAQRAFYGLEREENLNSRLRMQLYISLGLALIFTAGLIEGTWTALTKTLAIAESLDDASSQLRALWAIYCYLLYKGENRAAQGYAERFLSVARESGDLADALVGERLMGHVLHYGGKQRASSPYLERMLELYTAPSDQRHTVWFVYDQALLARVVLARVRWLQGLLVQAQRDAKTSLEYAHATNHKLSVCYALAWAVFPMAMMSGDRVGARHALDMLIELSGRNGFTFWENWGSCLEGELLIKSGEFDRGSAVLRAGIERLGTKGFSLRNPEFLGTLAEGLAGIGCHAESLETIELAITQSRFGGRLWSLPETLRIKGEILLQTGNGSVAEECFSDALAMAHEQGALFWEMRSALSLARLRLHQGREDHATQLLAPIYCRFREGFEAAELCSARDILALARQP